MAFQNRSLPIMIALLVIASVIAPAVVAADHGELTIETTQADDGAYTVTVSHGNDTVAGANVTVEAAENESYGGAGDYNTDGNGTVSLPAPSADVNVTITAENGTDNATTTTLLEAPEPEGIVISVSQDAANAVTIAVTDNGSAANGTVDVEVNGNESYEGVGTHNLTDGSVSLPAPNESVSVTITAEIGNETVSTTATLTGALEQGPDLRQIGKWISSLAGTLPEDSDHKNFGQYVKEFVHSVKDKFTPPGQDKKSDNANAKSNGNGNGNGPKDKGDRGPPEHANNGGNDDGDEEETETATSD